MKTLLAWEAILYAIGVLVISGLIPGWGRWYSTSAYHQAQTQAFLHGRLALSRNASDVTHDLSWSGGGVQQVWGLGIPLWRALFNSVAILRGQPGFPDRFALGLFMTLAAYAVLRTLVAPTIRTSKDTEPETFICFSFALGAILLLLLFPPFLSLLQCRAAIYEEVLAYVHLYGLLLVCSVVALARRPSWSRFWCVCALAGFGGLVRPTLVFYGLATVVTAGVIIWQANERQVAKRLRLGERVMPWLFTRYQVISVIWSKIVSLGRARLCRALTLIWGMDFTARQESRPTGFCCDAVVTNWRLWVGVSLFVAGGAVLWWTNFLRFGGGFEFGHRLNMQSGSLLGSVYATRFDHPFQEEPWWRAARELFGALFMARDFNGGDWYAREIFAGQSPTVRWREFYFTTYDLTYFALVLAGWVAGIGSVWRWWKERRQTTKALVNCTHERWGETPSSPDSKAASVPGLERTLALPGFTGSESGGVLHPTGSVITMPLPAVLALWSLLASAPSAVFYLRTPAISSRYMMDFAPAFAVAIVVAWWWAAETLHAKKPEARWITVVLWIALLGWLGWEIGHAESKYGPPRSVAWQNVIRGEEQRKAKPTSKPLPSGYRSGEDLTAWGIPYNGAGWDVDSGAVKVCVILFVDSPAFLELEVASAPDRQTTRADAEHIRAKVGLEFLKRESLERTADGWRVRFAGPTRPRYQRGIQPVFIATVPKERLADQETPWLLKKVSWRAPAQKELIKQ